jgi:multiple sugar transport system substrate-binding protein
VLPCNERCGGILGADSLVIAEDTRNAEAAYTFVDYLTSFEPHTERILASGLTPMLEGQAELEEFQTPFWRPFIEMIDIGFPEAQPLAWEPFEQIISDMIQSVFLGQRGVEEALAQAADQIRDQQLEPVRAD